jgi:predicted regulator of Ras-like GTPase activity (Roadblock/LC7/MglB family)
MREIDGVLEPLKRIGGVRNVLLASTSGAHIWGDAPKNTHLETFTTMSAILLGAAHTATKELSERLDHVEVKLENSNILIHPAGHRALIVLNVEKGANEKAILEKSMAIGHEIESML